MKLLEWLNKPVRPTGLGLFRVLFGLIMLIDVYRVKNIGLIESYYVNDRGVIFPYEFLNLPLPSEPLMKLITTLLMLCAVLVMLGVFYRYAMLLFGILFSYFFFLDQVLYNNHLYLVCIMSIMMAFMPADASFSLLKKRRKEFIPQWTYVVIYFQLFVVFFFGAVAKLNPFWLDLHVTNDILAGFAERTGMNWANTPFFSAVLAYGGVLFDLLIVPVLLYPKTRKVGVVLAIFFNLSNSYIFDDIYIFPFLMICALLLFVDQNKLHAFLKKRSLLGAREKDSGITHRMKPWALAIIGVHVVIQLILPVRHYFVEGYPDWTSDHQRFAWRMKAQSRHIEEVAFSVWDLDTKQYYLIDYQKLRKLLYEDELQFMCYYPNMIVQFAHFLEEKVAREDNIKNCMIKCKVKVSFNGMKSQYIFDPNIDLLSESKKHDYYYQWVEPMPTEPAETNTKKGAPSQMETP